MTSTKIIFITGVSSGIGHAALERFLDLGHVVIGTLRQKSEIGSFQCQSKNKSNLKLIDLDLSQPSEVASVDIKIQNALNELGQQKIDIVVQNAGVALAAPYLDQSFSEVQQIITVNLLSLMQIVQKTVPLMKQKGGRFIHISSVSGQNGTPFLATYCASKHAVEGFSESLRRELHFLGIKVSVIGPGSIQTPIWKKGFELIKSKYSSSQFAAPFEKFMKFASFEEKNGLHVDAVVDDIVHAALSTQPKIRYAPVPRKFQNYYLAKLVPKYWVDRMTIKALGL